MCFLFFFFFLHRIFPCFLFFFFPFFHFSSFSPFFFIFRFFQFFIFPFFIFLFEFFHFFIFLFCFSILFFLLFFLFSFFVHFSIFLIFSRPSRRQTGKNRQTVPIVKMTISFNENSILGFRWTGEGSCGPFEGDPAFMFFFFFSGLLKIRLFFGLDCFKISSNIFF